MGEISPHVSTISAKLTKQIEATNLIDCSHILEPTS